MCEIRALELSWAPQSWMCFPQTWKLIFTQLLTVRQETWHRNAVGLISAVTPNPVSLSSLNLCQSNKWISFASIFGALDSLSPVPPLLRYRLRQHLEMLRLWSNPAGHGDLKQTKTACLQTPARAERERERDMQKCYYAITSHTRNYMQPCNFCHMLYITDAYMTKIHQNISQFYMIIFGGSKSK